MFRQRRFLPSLSLLSAFDAVIRTGTTAAASRELQLSQGTVSRLVQSLEEQLGRPLFVRQHKRLRPTDAAREYAQGVSTALDLIQRSSMKVAADLGGGTLSLAVLPAFGTRWLAPRLGQFMTENPGITINLFTRLRAIDFAIEHFDAMIYFGPISAPDDWHLKLFDERLTACIAPALAATRAIREPADLAGLQLFQIETRPNAWAAWFAGQDSPVSTISGMMFDQFAPIVEATIAGLGVALLPEYLADAEIRQGRLVPVLRRAVQGTGAYWLAWPGNSDKAPPLVALREWLRRQTVT